jgi:hypothetical protein
MDRQERAETEQLQSQQGSAGRNAPSQNLDHDIAVFELRIF